MFPLKYINPINMLAPPPIHLTVVTPPPLIGHAPFPHDLKIRKSVFVPTRDFNIAVNLSITYCIPSLRKKKCSDDRQFEAIICFITCCRFHL